MGFVTNVILAIGPEIERKDVKPKALYEKHELVREIDQWLDKHDHGPFGEQISTADNVVGGDKGFEANVYVGAFNFLAVSEFVDFVLTRQWQSPESVQLFVKRQDEDKFTVYEIGATNR